jgi:hypothetical protein
MKKLLVIGAIVISAILGKLANQEPLSQAEKQQLSSWASQTESTNHIIKGWLNPGSTDPHFQTVTARYGVFELLEIYKSNVRKGRIDGGLALGRDLSSADTTAFNFFEVAKTYNGEAMSAGAVLFGSNSAGKPNILVDAGNIYVREGTVVAGEVAGGTFDSYGTSILGKGSGTTNDIVTGTDTVINFDHATLQVLYDQLGIFDTNNPTYVTINQDGKYDVSMGCLWETSWAGVAEMWLSINGTSSYRPLGAIDASIAGVNINTPPMGDSYEREFSDGDVLRMNVRQDSGSNKECQFAFMVVRKVGS